MPGGYKMWMKRPLQILLIAAALLLTSGCSNNPFRTAGIGGPVQMPPAAVMAPAAENDQRYNALDRNNQELESLLARSRQESKLLEDEVLVLREQLSSTSNQLSISRPVTGSALPGSPGTITSPVQSEAGTPAVFASASTMQAAASQLAMPGMQSRMDGSVVRIEIPSDKLFESGSATLMPGAAAILTTIASEVDRLFPDHFVGIEGHTDTEPLSGPTWTSPHQLSSARAATVFEFLTARTSVGHGQLFLVAHGANHPIVSNATAAGRARNRRIELVVYPERSAPN